MKIAVLGAGALGSVMGGCLKERGSEVHLLARSKLIVEAINTNGLKISENGTNRTVRVHATTDPGEIGPVDLLIVLVKSFHTKAAMEGARALVGSNTTVLSLQNGLGHEDILSELIGRGRVIVGRTYVGGVMLGPGHVLAAKDGQSTMIGELDGRVTERVRRIADEFGRAGFHVSVEDNILGAIWDKLLINVATGALCGITKMTYGELYTLEEMRDCALSAVAEAIAVAQAGGVTLSITDPRDAWHRASDGLPSEFKPSMLQSLERGSLTEVDYINGAVVRAGRKLGVSTPVNQTLVSCIKGIERALNVHVSD